MIDMVGAVISVATVCFVTGGIGSFFGACIGVLFANRLSK